MLARWKTAGLGVAAGLVWTGLSLAQPPSLPQPNSAPEWLRKPSYEDMLAVYPAEAGKRGASGTATIKCIVQIDGLTRDCSVVSEDRPGLGFGPSAVVLSRTFLFKPAMRNGQPVEAEVTVPLHFQTDSASPEIWAGNSRIVTSNTTVRVLPGAAWSKAPTVSEVVSAIDKKVGDKFADGKVVMQCELSKRTGKLGRCKVANTSPGMTEFTGVTNALIPKFQADTGELAGIKEDIAINLAFAFPNMASPEWGKRYLTHPEWIQTFDPASKISTFPDAAAKAGLKTGTATVDCIVAPNGALTQCETVRESTPNVGFGDTAIRIAQAFVANPWNDDGLPVDGAHVRMPIQMDYKPPRQ
jgi:TonB family protein